MTSRSQWHRTLPRLAATAAVLCCLASVAGAQGVRWKVDSKGSLAWWQIDPHMNHLWGTTCPQEPSWRPGEGRSGGWQTEEAMQAKTLAHGFSDVSDTIHVPLYPRRRVRFVCTEAVAGDFVVDDTAHWRGARGQIAIKSNDIVTGENMRDVYAKNGILAVSTYPEIQFKLDSLVGMTRGRGDTVRGTAMGTWTFRGVTKPLSARIQAYSEAGGTRVTGKFGIPTRQLIDDYGVWKRTLGLGVYMGIWKTIFMGVDLLLRPEGVGAN